MIKILIVDDEVPIREWLAYSISKKCIDYEIVGLAQNGREAIELINEKKPDLIFTDIKMPVMDGIEVLNYIKSNDYKCYIVVLTSYADFEFARQALKHNADEYILKTEIDDRSIKEIIERYKTKMTQRDNGNRIELNFFKHTFANEILKKNITDKKVIASYFNKAQIEIDDSFIIAIAVDINEIESNDKISRFYEMDTGKFITKKCIIFYNSDTVLILANLAKITSQFLQIQTIHQLANKISRYFDRYVSVSSLGADYEQICKITKECIEGLKLKFYDNNHRIVFCDGTKNQQLQIQEIIASKEYLLSLIEHQKFEKSIEVFQQLSNNVKQYEIADIDFIKKLLLQIINQYAITYSFCIPKNIINFMQEMEMKVEGIKNYDKLILFCKLKINEIANQNNKDDGKYSKYIKETIKYTNDNYKSIQKIHDITDVLNINTEYFCRLFKSEVGKTYINYLTDIKMMKSIELLKNTNMKINEISEVVGYNNFSYFSKTFKKKFKISPLRYRNEL